MNPAARAKRPKGEAQSNPHSGYGKYEDPAELTASTKVGNVEPNDAWPEFSIPTGEPEAAPQASGAGSSSGTQPPAAAPEPRGTVAPVAAPPADEMIPKYRVDELSRQVEQLTRMNERLMGLVPRPQSEPAADPDPEAERKAKLVQELAELDPKLARAMDLGASADKILAVIERLEAQEQRDLVEWDGFAKQTLSSIHDAFAKGISNGQKTGKDLPQETQQTLTDNFITWVMKDGQRTERYNRRDTTLQNDFLQAWRQTWVEPWRRQQAAGDVKQARRVSNLPVSGSTSSPMGTPPPKPNDSDDEDAIFRRGFRDSMERMGNS